MIQTQVSINKSQINWLKNKARDKGVTVSQLIREGINLYRAKEERLTIEKRKKALAAVGRFSSGRSDISTRHDECLAEAFMDKK